MRSNWCSCPFQFGRQDLTRLHQLFSSPDFFHFRNFSAFRGDNISASASLGKSNDLLMAYEWGFKVRSRLTFFKQSNDFLLKVVLAVIRTPHLGLEKTTRGWGMANYIMSVYLCSKILFFQDNGYIIFLFDLNSRYREPFFTLSLQLCLSRHSLFSGYSQGGPGIGTRGRGLVS